MMNIKKLVLGELRRLITYKILPISLVTAFIWIIIFLFISKEEARTVAPLLIFVDVTMMSILLIGASYHFEKQEGTIKSMMMMPVSLGQILSAKMMSAMVLGIESAIITSIALYFIHGITFNYALLLVFVIIAGGTHAAIGFFLSLSSKDFTSTLGLLMVYMIFLGVPSILFSFNVIPVEFDWLLMLSPSHSASTLINSVVTSEYHVAKVIAGCLYLIILAGILLKFVVFPKFKDNAVRG